MIINILLAFLAIILTLVLIVGIHELGHALAAKCFHVKIKRFSIGFGKPVFIYKHKTMEWMIGRWPLGGYVSLLNSRIEPVTEQDYNFCFDKKPVYVRILILLAGGIANFLTAWILLIIVYQVGIMQKVPEIKAVIAYSLAAKAGIKAGDRIIEVSKKVVPSWREVNMQFLLAIGKTSVPITLQSVTGEVKTLFMNMQKISIVKKRQSLLKNFGIIPQDSSLPILYQADSWADAIYKANHYIYDIIEFMWSILMQILTGIIPFSLLLGPLGMLAITATSLLQGVVNFLYFIAGFSIAVGFVNFFPLPGLDGGSILYACLEKIRAKPISVAVEVLLYQLTVIAFCMLLANLIGNDLQFFGN